MGSSEFSWPHLLSALLAGESLSEDQTAVAMREIMDGEATPAQVAGFVVALRAKGVTGEELAGLVRTMREFATKVSVGDPVLDTCGTGGDRAGTFNVSTAAALVCAGAGVKVAKHGNRAASSRCGSADVLEALGVKIDLSPDDVARCIAQAGMGFCFAPIFHPAMRHTATPRRELGIPTIFNFLGPLTNPAGARRQALGVADRTMIEPMVDTLRRLGSERVVAFHGRDGLDELTTTGPSDVVELKDNELRRWVVDPAELGLDKAALDDVAGGTPDENAATIRHIFDGASGPQRDIVALNAAAGFVAAGRAEDMAAGLALSHETIDSGCAREGLERLIEVSNSLARGGPA
ncbi:MAG: anthranilate phosphoribosyltransferase [Actinomycetota bacterium]|nr:anthranilate phosphoribosyltransferase [Actinomycetota bacterium]